MMRNDPQFKIFFISATDDEDDENSNESGEKMKPPVICITPPAADESKKIQTKDTQPVQVDDEGEYILKRTLVVKDFHLQMEETRTLELHNDLVSYNIIIRVCTHKSVIILLFRMYKFCNLSICIHDFYLLFPNGIIILQGLNTSTSLSTKIITHMA